MGDRDGDILANSDLRKKIVDLIFGAGEGHIPSAFSIIDLLAFLYSDFLKFDHKNPQWPQRDYFILSKGHGCAALYVILQEYGFITKEDLTQKGRENGILGGHPDCTKIPGVEASTGSLGHGIGTALGVALGLRIRKMNNKVICLIGDGESNEGTVWECALVAAHLKLGSLCCILDNNGSAEKILPVTKLREKWEAFDWEVHVIDGHNTEEIAGTFKKLKFESTAKPKMIVANTKKGKGISFMEAQPTWHYKAPKKEELDLIYKELNVEIA